MDATERWLEELRATYLFAKGARLNELDGRRVGRFDGRGLHSFSYSYGRSSAWFELTGLAAELQPTAHQVDAAGFADGTAEWLADKAGSSGQTIRQETFQVQPEPFSVP